jgi:flagellar basal-body rod protein FlgC
MGSMFSMMDISASALAAERQRAEVTSANLANADTTHTSTGGPYVRKEVVFSATSPVAFNSVLSRMGNAEGLVPGSVTVAGVVDDPTPPIKRYEPGNPDADKDGYVEYPAIHPEMEMVDLMNAVRTYQLNASAIGAAKQMISESIDILKTT